MANLSDAKIVDFNGLQFYHKNLMKKVDSKVSITDESTYGYMQDYVGYFKSLIGPITIKEPGYDPYDMYFAGISDAAYFTFDDRSEYGIVLTGDPTLMTGWSGVEGSACPYIYNLNGVITNGSSYFDTNDLSIFSFQPCTVTGWDGIDVINWQAPNCYKYKQSLQINDVVLFAYVPEGDTYCYIFSTTDGKNVKYLTRIQSLEIPTGFSYVDGCIYLCGYVSKWNGYGFESYKCYADTTLTGSSLENSIADNRFYSSSNNFSSNYNTAVTDPDTGLSSQSRITSLTRYNDVMIATFVKNVFADAYGNGAGEAPLYGPAYLMTTTDGYSWSDLNISGVSALESFFASEKCAYIVPWDAAQMDSEGYGYVPLYESTDLISWAESGENFWVDIWESEYQDIGDIGGLALNNTIIKANYVMISKKGIPVSFIIGLEEALNNAQIDMNSYIASDAAIDSIIGSYEG